jgi:hypothetical protein
MDREIRTASVAIPTHDKYRQYSASDKGKNRRAKERDKRASESLERYLTRPFVAWDGEGINEPDGSHTYVLLANSLGVSLSNRTGLPTSHVCETFLDSPNDVTHIIYGGGYDTNMILKDVDRDTLTKLYVDGRAKWNDYWMEWRGGKSFAVRTRTRRFLLYDVLPFFQRSFVSACDEYLGTDWEYRDEIIREKANRGTFDYANIGAINEYNKAELRTLVRLANELRERLYKVDIRVSRWDGPGAIASALYKKYDTKQSLCAVPDGVATAGRYAYAGGRFEIIRKGHSESGAYQYDIRSAYPSAIRLLPCLTHGEWRHVERPTHIARFGVYRVEVTEPATQSITQPQPLWHRNPDGTVFFSEYPHGWYWSPEAQLAQDMGGVIIWEGWEYVERCECNPFAFVEALYNKRAALKRAGDGAHVGLKLGLNSLYGKLAQQIGWSAGPPLKLPPYHSLEWAGFITSHCRAQVYRASLLAPDDIIAFETDAVFSRVPLALDIGERLGEWEETKYASLTYLKSGMYFGTLANGKEVEKTRGINKGTITRADMVAALDAEQRGETPVLAAEQTRFITLGQALHQDFAKWTHWITAPRGIKVALNGKRIDLLDSRDTWADRGDGWRETQEGFHDTEFSHPYEVEWINGGGIKDRDDKLLARVRLDDAHEEWSSL